MTEAPPPLCPICGKIIARGEDATSRLVEIETARWAIRMMHTRCAERRANGANGTNGAAHPHPDLNQDSDKET